MRAVAAERDGINAARGEGEFAVADSQNRVKTGAGERSRTLDLRITNALLYQLSYTGIDAKLRDARDLLQRYPSKP